MKFLLLICALISIGQSLNNPNCPNVPTLDLEKVDLDQYSGRWYQIAAKPDNKELGYKCFNADISKANSTSYSITYNSLSVRDNKPFSVNTWLARNTFKPGNPYEYYINLSPYGLKTAKYGIVDTDYKNFAIIYSCDNSTGVKVERFYINSRTQGLNAYNSQLLSSALLKLNANGVNINNFIYSASTDKCN